MRNDDLQYQDQFKVNKMLQTTSNSQALVLSAYIEEKSTWEKKLNAAKNEATYCLENLANLKAEVATDELVFLSKAKMDVNSEIGFLSQVLRFLRIKTKAQKKLNEVEERIGQYKKEIKNLEEEYKIRKLVYNNLYSNPPDTTQYELAMIGNKLFRPK